MGRITGTKAADTLTGTPGNDTISGLAGADVIEGSAGDDLIEGGTGDDTISGGEGNDILKGGSGDDILTGNQGSDSVYGGEGQDSLYDSGIYNNAGGSDLLDGGEGDDRISIYRSSDESGTNITIFGGGGNDIIDISAGSISSSIMGTTIILDAGIGNDIINISGSGLNANITLGEGKDVLSILSILSILNLSGHGLNSEVIITDFVPGALGDRIEWTYGLPVTLNKWNNDSNPFGSGYARLLQNDGDTLLQIDPDGGANEYVTLIRFSNTMASAFTEFNFESYHPNGTMPTGQVFAGTTGNDTMIGTVSADTFQGGDGDDFIEARAGSDRILGGIGNDYIDGQLGDDWIDGGPGHDQIRGGYGNDVLIGGDGNDDIDDGGSLDDRIFGGSGDDILRVIYNFQGIVGKSYLNGGEGNDIIFFTIHNDSLVEIDAGDGNDTVSAEADSGTGIVRLGVGSDTLLLRDIYSPYGPWNGSISVEDFSVGVGGDKVVFSEAMRFWKGYVIGIDPFDLGYLRLVQFENRTILQIDRDGYSGEENYFENMVYFDNIDAREFVKYNFDGFVPKIVPASEAITADITAPVSVSEDGEKVLSLKLILSGNSYINGIISINIEEQSTTTINADVILKEKILGYDFVRSPSGSYGLTLPPISILSDFIAEGTETIAVTIRVSGQVFDTGTDTKTVLVKLIDSGQTGGPGEDRIGGTRFSDDLSGGQGNDRLSGNLGNDNIDGGSGIDTAVFGDFFKKSTVSAQSASVTVVGPDGTDIATGVEYFQFTDGMFVTDADSAGAQVMRLYDTILDRAPDAVGLEFYVDRIEDRGVSLAAVANEIAGSAEFQTATGGLNNGQFVDYVYQKALGRTADASGKAFYTQLLDAGLSRGVFVADLSESVEHRGLTAEMVANGYFSVDDSYQAVTLFYDSFLGRRPDVGGLQYYADRVKSGTMSLSQVADDFAGSSEFKAAIQGKSNAELVDYVYRNTLDRAPDAGGAAYYTDLLNKGFAPAAFVTEVSLSQEHYNLMSGAIINGIDLY